VKDTGALVYVVDDWCSREGVAERYKTKGCLWTSFPPPHRIRQVHNSTAPHHKERRNW
jgi:hypothetical protein